MLASTDVKTLCALLKASIATSVNFSEFAIQIFCTRFRLTLSWRQCAVEVCHHKFFVVAFCFQSLKNKPTRYLWNIKSIWHGLVSEHQLVTIDC